MLSDKALAFKPLRYGSANHSVCNIAPLVRYLLHQENNFSVLCARNETYSAETRFFFPHHACERTICIGVCASSDVFNPGDIFLYA